MNLFDLYAKITLDDSDYEDGLKRAGEKSSTFGATLKKGLAGAAKFTASAIGAASTAVTALGKIAFNYNSELESYETNLAVMLGNTEAAKAKVQELAQMGAETPFELADLASATQTLLAFNISGDETTGVLQKLGDISLGNVQKLESLTRAYGKMNSSQKVTLEDINMMIDAGYNPLLNIQEQTGESMEQLYKRVSQGKVAFSEIEAAIEMATAESGKYHNGMAQASKTTQGMISTLKDNAQMLVGKVFEPISEGMTEQLLPAAIDAIEELSEAYEEKGVEGMSQAAGSIVGGAIGELAVKAPALIDSGVDLVENLLTGVQENQDQIVSGGASTFFSFVRGIAVLFPQLLSTAVGLIGSLGTYIAENPDEVCEAAGTLFSEFILALVNAIPGLLVTALNIIAALGQYLVDNADAIWESAKAVGQKIVDGVWAGIQSVWHTITSKFGGLIDKLIAGAKLTLQGGIGDSLLGNVSGSHAGGLDYVPYNGYIAQLHRGEMVLTAEEAGQIRRGRLGGSGITVIQNIYSQAKTAADLMAEAQYQQERAVLLGV